MKATMNGSITEREDAMPRRVAVLLLASLGALGALAPSASGAANPQRANCFALFVSNAEPGSVGSSASSNAQDPEAHPFGLNVVSFSAHLSEPDCGE
jgi:hypothetical protein